MRSSDWLSHLSHGSQKFLPIDTEPYLNRIKILPERPGPAFLRKLHYAHLLNIPLENLDVHYGKPIVLECHRVYEKVISSQRGGVAYELNFLFAHLLSSLGFEVYLGSAQTFTDQQPSPDFEQLVVFVVIHQEVFLCDVGNSLGFSIPKKLVADATQLDYNAYFKLMVTADDEWQLKKSADNQCYQTVYQFRLASRGIIEFIPRCNFHQDPLSGDWRLQKFISQLFSDGRATLTDRKLELQLRGEQKIIPVLNEDDFLQQLQTYFRIDPMALLRQKFD